MDDAITGDDVLLEHHLDSVNGEALTITADLDVVTLKRLVGGASHNGFRAQH